MPTTNEELFSEKEANELMSFYAGMDYAYDQLNSLIFAIDPEAEAPEMWVVSNYLDAWWAEMNYKREQAKSSLSDMKRGRMPKLLNTLSISENIESMEFAPEFVDEVNKKCKIAIHEVFNKYMKEGGDTAA